MVRAAVSATCAAVGGHILWVMILFAAVEEPVSSTWHVPTLVAWWFVTFAGLSVAPQLTARARAGHVAAVVASVLAAVAVFLPLLYSSWLTSCAVGVVPIELGVPEGDPCI